MKKYFWFHNATIEGCEFFSSEDPSVPETATYGPFNSFSEAKEDALDYYRTDLKTARENIRRVKATRRNRPWARGE